MARESNQEAHMRRTAEAVGGAIKKLGRKFIPDTHFTRIFQAQGAGPDYPFVIIHFPSEAGERFNRAKGHPARSRIVSAISKALRANGFESWGPDPSEQESPVSLAHPGYRDHSENWIHRQTGNRIHVRTLTSALAASDPRVELQFYHGRFLKSNETWHIGAKATAAATRLRNVLFGR